MLKYILHPLAPLPNDHQIRPFLVYLKADLFHERQDQEWRSETMKTTDEGDAMWNQSIEWDFDHDELAFLRYVLFHLYCFITFTVMSLINQYLVFVCRKAADSKGMWI